jgi:hypothetical protein
MPGWYLFVVAVTHLGIWVNSSFLSPSFSHLVLGLASLHSLDLETRHFSISRNLDKTPGKSRKKEKAVSSLPSPPLSAFSLFQLSAFSPLAPAHKHNETMISAVRIASTRAARMTVVPRAVGSTRFFGIGDALTSKVSASS